MPTGTIAPKAPADPERVRTAIRQAGLTQKQMADRLGVHFTLLSKWLNESREMDWPTLTRIAIELGVPWPSLLMDECRTCHRKVAA